MGVWSIFPRFDTDFCGLTTSKHVFVLTNVSEGFQAFTAVQSACPFFREEQKPDAACKIYPVDEENIGLFIQKLVTTCPKQTTAQPRRPQYEFSQQ
jgi:hypothetical protein